MTERAPFLGVGIYSVSDAAKLTGVPSAAIRRWLWGYRYRYCGEARVSQPLWSPELPEVDNSRALGFRDLIEILFVKAFKEKGVSLRTIRRAIEQAEALLGEDYPLSSLKFKTDGKSILADVVEPEERRLVFDLVTGQYLLENVFDRLREGLDYSQLQGLQRWWPIGREREVVVDPKRSFGQPIVASEGVPTEVLASAYHAEQSVDAVASWYDVTPEAVNDALEFERTLQAA